MPNGEIVGLRIAEGGTASNEGKTYHRYSLRGSWFEISVVDASNTSVSSYGLNDAVEVCVPLPDALRSNISDLAIVAINADDSLTILSSECGYLLLPAPTYAAVSARSRRRSPWVPLDRPRRCRRKFRTRGDASDLPETGGAAPSSDGMLWAMMFGLAIVVSGYGVLRAARRRTNQMR